MKDILKKALKYLGTKPAIFIYGFITGWVCYLLVLVAVMNAWG